MSVEWGARNIIGPAPRERPGPGTQEASPGCTATVTPEALASAARVRAEAMRNKSYRVSPIGGEVGRFLRALKWGEKAQNTVDTYELCLSRLAVDFAHIELHELTTEMLPDFLAEHWGDSSAATRANRLAAVKSFLRWAVDEGRLERSPADPIKRPKAAKVERQAYSMDVVDELRRAQPDLRDQIAIQLLGRLALRKNELRVLQVKDFDLQRGTVVVKGKGAKTVVLPLGFADLKTDLHLHLIGRSPDEYLLYPKNDASRPMDHASVHPLVQEVPRTGRPVDVDQTP
jgi:integrase